MPRCASSKTPRRALDRAGERPLLVPEQLALEQRLGNGGAVDRDKRKGRARAQLVDRLGDELLAGARLAVDQHRGGRRRGLLDDLVDLADRGTVADDPAERAVVAQLAPQPLDLTQRRLPLDRLVEQHAQPLGVDRLAQVVIGAFLHGGDRRVDGALRRQDQHGQAVQLLAQGTEQIEAGPPRHHQIAHDDRGAERRHLLQRFVHVAGAVGDEAPGRDELGQALARRRVIFDDQHPLAGGDFFGILVHEVSSLSGRREVPGFLGSSVPGFCSGVPGFRGSGVQVQGFRGSGVPRFRGGPTLEPTPEPSNPEPEPRTSKPRNPGTEPRNQGTRNSETPEVRYILTVRIAVVQFEAC